METLVLIHGFAEDARIWETITPELGDQYHIMAPNLPNAGSMEELAEHIHSLLLAQNIERCSMIGHSMGGYITLAFASKYPEKLNRFGLFHSTAYADSEEKQRARLKNVDFIRKHGTGKFLEQSTPKLFAPSFAERNGNIVKELIDRYRHLSPEMLVNHTLAMRERPDRTEILREFKKPILFIAGEYDTAVPLEHTLQQCSIPEFSYIYVATHSGHLGMIEETAFCASALKEFLAS